jgi:hypothetical protein
VRKQAASKLACAQRRQRVAALQIPPLLASLRFLLGDDPIFDLVTGGLGNDILAHQLIFFDIGASLDDFSE